VVVAEVVVEEDVLEPGALEQAKNHRGLEGQEAGGVVLGKNLRPDMRAG